MDLTDRLLEGRPWWLSDLSQVIVGYADADRVNEELRVASDYGWSVSTTTSTDGHINVGRTMTKFFFGGVPLLMTGASRTAGTLTVTWNREPGDPVIGSEPRADATDPTQALQTLARLSELGLITPEEFQAKRAEVLMRL